MLDWQNELKKKTTSKTEECLFDNNTSPAGTSKCKNYGRLSQRAKSFLSTGGALKQVKKFPPPRQLKEKKNLLFLALWQ